MLRCFSKIKYPAKCCCQDDLMKKAFSTPVTLCCLARRLTRRWQLDTGHMLL